MADDNISEQTRRAILKGAAATLGIAGVSSGVIGHPGSGDHGNEGHEHAPVNAFQMTNVGYHSLGGVGSESVSGGPDDPHYGGVSELRVKGDIAAVGLLSSDHPTVDRGIAILDVSAYTRANDGEDLERKEMTVLSYVPNENNLTSVMDVKFSDDGAYLFATQQPIAGIFAAQAGQVPELRTEGESADNPESGAVLAIDVSDPGDPEIVGRQEYGFGLHNCYHHRINGEDYVFGVTGPIGEPAGIYVHRFDRTIGDLELVNFWSHDTNLATGKVGPPTHETLVNAVTGNGSNEYYAHDIAVIDDPVTGDPYAYLANWNTGARVLDVSDPRDIHELGRFEMERAHTIEALQRTVDGKRLFVVGQENPEPDGDTSTQKNRHVEGGSAGHTGYYYLVDATGVEDGDASTDLGHASKDGQPTPADGERRDTELAKWVWRLDAHYADFTYSAHNIDVIDTEVGGTRRLFVTAGHYHVGTRVLEIGYPGGPAIKEEDCSDCSGHTDHKHDQDHAEPISKGGNASGRDGWLLAETGWTRTHFDTPEEAKFGSLSAATPYRWCAVEENGVIFSSDISTGVYAMTLDNPQIPVGTRTVLDPDVTLDDDGSAFTGGQTNHVTLEISTEAPAEVRLNIPKLWDVVAGDPHTVREVADNTIVEFDEPIDGDGTLNVFLEAPEEPTGTRYAFGPVEVTPDVGEKHEQQVWQAVPDTEEANFVVGISQP